MLAEARIAEAKGVRELESAVRESGCMGARKAIANGDRTPPDWMSKLRQQALRRLEEIGRAVFAQHREVGANEATVTAWKKQVEAAEQLIKLWLDEKRVPLL